jgi:hypothetical protein
MDNPPIAAPTHPPEPIAAARRNRFAHDVLGILMLTFLFWPFDGGGYALGDSASSRPPADANQFQI